jgi:SAM-dependent methyltransferase
MDRERLLFLYLRDHTDIFSRPQSVLHVAPERRLSQTLQAQPHLTYLSVDIASPRAMVSMDLTRTDLPDGKFDAILCNHVLEHIGDDRKAMTELFRILKPGGWAIVQVPIELDAGTSEDASITDPAVRTRIYGQFDHVRLYGARDYPDRLASAGFAVEVCDYAAQLGAEARRFALLTDEKVYVARKPLRPSTAPTR